MAATAAALSAVSAKSALAACARSTNSATAGTAPASASGGSRPGSGSGSGATAISRSARMCSGSRLVARMARFGQAASRAAMSERGPKHLLAVVEHQQEPAVPQVPDDGLPQRRRPAASRTPSAVAMVGTTRAGSVSGERSTKQTPSAIAVQRLGGDRLGQVGLPRAARTGERHEADIVLRQKVGERGHLGLPADQARGGKRERRQWRGLGSPSGCGRHLGARHGEEPGAIVLPEPEGVGEHAHRLQPRRPVHAPLQIAERPHAHPRAFGQLLLGEGRRRAVPPQEIAEAGKIACCHASLVPTLMHVTLPRRGSMRIVAPGQQVRLLTFCR